MESHLFINLFRNLHTSLPRRSSTIRNATLSSAYSSRLDRNALPNPHMRFQQHQYSSRRRSTSCHHSSDARIRVFVSSSLHRCRCANPKLPHSMLCRTTHGRSVQSTTCFHCQCPGLESHGIIFFSTFVVVHPLNNNTVSRRRNEPFLAKLNLIVLFLPMSVLPSRQ